MRITVSIHENANNVSVGKRTFYMEDEGELMQVMESIESFVSDVNYELKEEV